MFLPVLAVACAAFGCLSAERLRTGDKLLVVACLSLLAVKGVVASLDRPQLAPVAATAAEWVRAEPDAISATPFAAAILTLTPEVRRLPWAVTRVPSCSSWALPTARVRPVTFLAGGLRASGPMPARSHGRLPRCARRVCCSNRRRS
jgi:hypothetical protein